MPKLASKIQSAVFVTTLTGRTNGKKKADKIGKRSRFNRSTNNAKKNPVTVLGTTVNKTK